MIEEPKDMAIPSLEDFYFDGDVDRWALDNYLGKDIDYAEQRYYRFYPLSVLHDLTQVGVVAFRYYIFGAFRYLQDIRSNDDSDVYSALPEMVLERMRREPDGWASIASYVVDFCDFAIQDYDRHGVEGFEDIYGDVRQNYRTLRSMASQLAEK